MGKPYGRYTKEEYFEFLAQNDIDPESLTCAKCQSRETCPWVDDAYNTNGDCLATK